jgi:hypothetical protein
VKFLCLIYLNEQEMDALPPGEMDALNRGHLDLNDRLRARGNFIEADALEPARAGAWLRLRKGKLAVTDGPFTETKELVAGFYLIDARDMPEAVEIAAQFPSAPHATIEIRPTRQLVVEGR